MPEDAQLLRRYVEEKSEAAFAALVSRHLDLVYSAALRQVEGDAHRARDVAQAVFTTLARRAGTLTGHPALTGWLYTTTHHVAARAQRTEWRRRQREQEAYRMQEDACSETAPADWPTVRPVLDAAMRELSERDREAVLLRYFAQHPFAEIGATLHVSEDAARMRVERALDRLRAILARHGVTSTAGALAAALSAQAVTAAPAGLAAAVSGAAFASAAATAPLGMAGWIVFMSTPKIVTATAGLIALLAAGTAFYEFDHAREAQLELGRERAASAARVAALEQRARTAEQATAQASARAGAAEAKLAQANPAPGVPARPAAPDLGMGKYFADPRYIQASVENYRLSLHARYAALYRRLHLTPDQITRFEATLIRKEQAVDDIFAAAATQGIDNDSALGTSVARMTAAPNKTMQDELKDVLGADGFAQYRSYEKNYSARTLVESLASTLYSVNAPLTTEQGDALVELIATNTQVTKTPMADDGKGPVYMMNQKTDWAAVHQQAIGTLAPAQLDALDSVVKQKELANELIQMRKLPAAPRG